MRKRQVGRPRNPKPRKLKLELTTEQWKLLEQYSITPTSTFGGLARMINISGARPDQRLKILIKYHYKDDPDSWLETQHQEGIAKFGQSFFTSACDPKGNPILKIFGGKNWLGLKDERTIKSPDTSNSTAIKVMETFNNILKSLNTNNQAKQIPKIEINSLRSEYADYTPINTPETNDKSQSIETQQYSNIKPIDSIVTHNQDGADTQDNGDSTV